MFKPTYMPASSRSALRSGALMTCAVIVACLPVMVRAADEKAPFDAKNAHDGGLGMPSPFDKFLALDQVFGEGKLDWRGTFSKVAVDIDPDAYTDEDVVIPMVLGVRIADGVMAVKARDAELLNRCASDIEKLAQKMGLKDADLTRARAVRAAANSNDWLKVFMELGFLQQDIMQKIQDGGHSSSTRGDLLIACGWMQGARYTATVVESNYSPEASGILREPLLIKAIESNIAQMPKSVQEEPAVAKMREVLPQIEKILAVPLNGAISKANVAQLNALSTEVVKAAINPGS
jgi:hypothetical protein